MEKTIDVYVVPLGNGALIKGMGTWIKRFSPTARVIAVCPAGAPAMEMSWRAGKAVSTPTMDTIADGIAGRVPVQEALDIMPGTVDDMMLVTDDEIVEAMRWLHREARVVVEPAGAAGVAAVANPRNEVSANRGAVA